MTPGESADQKDNLLRKAESAWLAGDLNASTHALAAKAGASPNFVREAILDPSALHDGVTLEPLYLHGRPLSSSLVRMEQAVAVFDIGVPLLQDGTFYSHDFAYLKYPERYTHLFGEDAGRALQTAGNNAHHASDVYVTLIRPPYYHWLLDTVPHLFGISRLGHVDQVNLIAPDSMTFQPWQRSLLEKAAGAFGLNNLAYRPTNGSVIGARPCYSQTHMPLHERLNLLRLLAPPAPQAQPHRFLYSRRSANDVRRLQNEDAVISALEDRFTVIDPGEMDLDTQIKLFAEAQCVVGVHGSNLSNIAFCQPGTAVVEIAAGLPQPHFEKMAKAANLKFVRVDGTPVHQDSEQKTWAQAHGDLTVNPASVVGAVEEALDTSTTP